MYDKNTLIKYIADSVDHGANESPIQALFRILTPETVTVILADANLKALVSTKVDEKQAALDAAIAEAQAEKARIENEKPK